ncbi:hypothetical protein GCM10010965_15040 [Caldalkalibacillus thermarum]|uniref:cell wall-binding repeat-containing protein n=1 Tax=Caldalkalibacillus thermarum TaxID=296745 RepID=UPI0016651969|nr:cell wall-binding repeat-containing protein [Caldalkalibacillus thermarum]GGK23234.1 hypothetical protein GCM10010965_15040 [Caldalkalibacillus thermarum]
MTRPTKLHEATKKEIERLKAKKVIILGGENAVSKQVENTLKNMKLEVVRVAGSTRYDTAARIAQLVGYEGKTAVIASGQDFPDALAVAYQAAQQGNPILLVRKQEIPKEVKPLLNKVKNVNVIGGEAVVGKEVYNALPKDRKRISGQNRFETNAEIVKGDIRKEIPSAYVATGANFADALTGSVLAAKENKPILLVRQDRVPEAIMDVVISKNITEFTALGGKNAVPDHILAALKNRDKGTQEPVTPEPVTPGQPVGENPAYNPNYPHYDQWLNYTRISPSYTEHMNWMKERAERGEATPQELHRLRFEVEELLWEYYKGPIPASPYEAEAMHRLATKKYKKDRWENVSEYDKARGHGAYRSGMDSVMLESFSFNEEGKLEWVVIRPVGMRHAFKITIHDPIGSVVKNRGWAGFNNDRFDAVFAELATPELLQEIKDAKVPVFVDHNSNRADEWNERGLPYTHDDYTLREREIARRHAVDYVVRNIYGGDLTFEIGGLVVYMSREDLNPGSKLIPPQFLERKTYEKGQAPFMKTDTY